METKIINLKDIMEHGRPVPGTKRNIAFLKRNYKIVVKSPQPTTEVRKWLHANEIEYDEVVQDLEAIVYQKKDNPNVEKNKHDEPVQGNQTSADYELPKKPKGRYTKRNAAFWEARKRSRGLGA